MKASLNGTEIFFDIEGAGLAPRGTTMEEHLPCFTLHGGPALDHTYFKPWLSPLTDMLQLIYVDHRGTGRSEEAPPETYRLEQMADDLEALRRHLGLGKVGLIGSSYGGFLALTYALRYPDSVAILYALGTSPSKRFWDAAQPILEERGTPEQKAIAPSLVDGGISTLSAYRHWWQTMFPLYFHEYDEEVGSEIVQRIVGNAATAREMFTNDMPAYDVEDRLREIEAPTLVLVGKHDWVTPVSESELIASGVKNAELIVYEHSGHFIFIEEHEKFLRDMREFTSKYAPPQPEPVRTIEAQP